MFSACVFVFMYGLNTLFYARSKSSSNTNCTHTHIYMRIKMDSISKYHKHARTNPMSQNKTKIKRRSKILVIDQITHRYECKYASSYQISDGIACHRTRMEKVACRCVSINASIAYSIAWMFCCTVCTVCWEKKKKHKNIRI